MNKFAIILLFVFGLQLIACKNTTREFITQNEVTGQKNIYSYDINFPEEIDLLFYTVEVKSPNLHSYSEVELELISFENLIELNSQELISVKVIENKNFSNFQLLVNDKVLATIKNDGLVESTIANRMNYCSLVTNSLFEFAFTPEDAVDDKVAHKFEFGFITLPEMVTATSGSEEENKLKAANPIEIDWEATFKKSKYLFWIFKSHGFCKDHPFLLEYVMH